MNPLAVVDRRFGLIWHVTLEYKMNAIIYLSYNYVSRNISNNTIC